MGQQDRDWNLVLVLRGNTLRFGYRSLLLCAEIRPLEQCRGVGSLYSVPWLNNGMNGAAYIVLNI